MNGIGPPTAPSYATPYPGTDNLLFWQTGSGTCSISLNNLEGGPIFAPTANNLSVTGSGPPVGGALTGLLQ